MHKVLLLSDGDSEKRHQLTSALASECTVCANTTLDYAIEDLRRHHPDLLMLLGNGDFGKATTIVRSLRSCAGLPVLYASSYAPLEARVALLDAGADDFIALPCGAGELRARVRAQLRRSSRPPPAQPFRTGSIAIDPRRKLASREGAPVRFTRLEYRVLQALIEGQGTPLSSAELMRRVWGASSASEGDTRRLRVCIRGLREKLESDRTQPRCLVTVPRFGYQLNSQRAP